MEEMTKATYLEIEEALAMNEEFDAARNGKSSLFANVFTVLNGGGANQLQMTAKLTQISSEIANVVFSTATNDEKYAEKVKSSFQSHDIMDDLINELYNLMEVDVEFLKSESTDVLEKMIRSQQSKRSRSKSKVMDAVNYKTMLIGAVAENLLRIAMDKPKSSGGSSFHGDGLRSAEDIQKLIDFPEDLTKAIRNVQSKKSIAKAKADYNPLSPRWLSLLAEEQQLKDLRDSKQSAIDPATIKAIETAVKVEAQLADENLDDMKPEDAKALLIAMKEMLAAK
jgi:hypothetical protein